MGRRIKVFYNFSARSNSQIISNSRKVISWIRDGDMHLMYDPFENGTREEIYSKDFTELEKIYLRATTALKQSDICILDISTHSLSQGYLLQKSLELSKPTIALYMKGKLPAFATGIHDSRLQVIEYNSDNLLSVLEQSITYASEEFDIRFNMMLSPTLNNHLKELAKRKNISRSSCVRQLIRDNMIANQVSST